MMRIDADATKGFPSQLSARRAMARKEISKAERHISILQKRLDYLKGMLADCDAAERVLAAPSLESLPEPDEQAAASTKLAHGRLRKEILDVLKASYPRALTVTEISENLSARLGLRFHEKSPSMTLTRLRKDGLVALDGRRWSYVSPDPASPGA